MIPEAAVEAAVVPAYTAPWEDELNFMVECVGCGIEWGWSRDKPGMMGRLKRMAEAHNEKEHA